MMGKSRGRNIGTFLITAFMLLALLPALPSSFPARAASSFTDGHPGSFASGTLSNITVAGPGANATLALDRTEADTWYRLPTPASPPARAYCELATIYGTEKALLFGGWNGAQHFDDTWVFDLGMGNWTQLSPPEKPSARDEYAMAAVDGTDTAVLFGGGDTPLNDTWLFNATSEMWYQQFPAESPPARTRAALAPVHGDDKVLLFGGTDWGRYFNDTWVYDLSDNNWSRLDTPEAPPARDAHALAMVPGDDKVLLFGGDNGWPYLNDTWVFDLGDRQWVWKNTTLSPLPCFGNSLCPLLGTGKFLLYGGYNLANQTWLYDLGKNEWTMLDPPNTPFPRTDYALAPVDGTDQALLFGGYSGSFRSSSWLFNHSGYCTEGCFTSAPHAFGGQADPLSLSWNATVPPECSVRFQLRSGNSTGDLAAAPFVGPNGSASTFYDVPGTAPWPGHNSSLLVQYRVRLQSSAAWATPLVRAVAVDFNLHPLAPRPLSPAEGAWANGSALYSWQFLDNDSSNQSAYRFQADESAQFNSIDLDSGDTVSADRCWTAVLPDGEHFWRVQTRDGEGAWGPYSSPRRARIDAVAPDITIITPPAGLVDQTEFTLYGTAADSSSGLESVEYRSDGGPWLTAAGTVNWRADLAMSAGPHTVSVRAQDRVGNLQTVEVGYTVNRPPRVNLTSPLEGGMYSLTDLVELRSEATDADGDQLTFIWKDGYVPIGTGPELSARFSQGNHSVSVTVSDGRGHEAVRWVNITVYSALPVPSVRLLSPFENEVLASGTLAVNYSVANFSVSPNPGGPHIHYSLDDGAEESWYSSSNITLTDITNGRHALRLWLVDAAEAGLPNPESHAAVNFSVNDPRWNLPDLAIAAQDISVKPERPRQGDEVSITFRVQNRGVQAASRFIVRLYVDGNETAEKTFRGLDAGANSTGKLVWWADFGNHTLRLSVDPSNEIAERNEANNEAALEVQAGPERAGAASGASWLMPLLLVVAVAAAAAVGYMVVRARRHGPAGRATASPPKAGPAVPPGGCAPYKPLDAPFNIDDLFLIYRDGRLFQHVSRRMIANEDSSEIMASMLTAVQHFIQDALSRGQAAVLGSMEYSGRKILLEGDRNLILAAVISGQEPDGLRCEMVQTIKDIEGEYSSIIPDWDGDVVAVAGTQRFLAALSAFRTEDLTELERRAESRLPTDVKVMSEVEFFQGFARLRVAARNEGDMLVADAALDLHFNEDILRLDRIEPSYQMSGKRVVLGNIGPKEKKSVAFYLDPQICTESAVDGVLTYRDAKGAFKTVPLKRRMVTVVCPILHTEENINTAMLRRMIAEELDQRDSKLFVVPEKLPLPDAYSLGKRSVEGHDIRFVREFLEKEPYKAEAWYFGKTKGRVAKLVIRVTARGEGRTLEFFVASGSRLAVTGLLAELRSDLVRRQRESAPAFQRMEQVIDLSMKEKADADRPLLEKYSEGDDEEIPK